MASMIHCLLTLLLAVNAAYGLKCYKCNSKDSFACSYGLTSFTYDVEECGTIGVLDSIAGPSCFKLTAKNKEGKEYIARGCAPPGTSLACSLLAKSVGWVSQASSDDPEALEDMNCVTCNSDKCNSAPKLFGATLIGFVLAVFAFLF